MVFRKRHPPVGARPGTLMMPHDSPAPKIRVIRYSSDAVKEMEPDSIHSIRAHAEPGTVTWIDVQGFGDEGVIRDLGTTFGLHALALEDVVNVPQRPKAEDYPEHLLVITRMPRVEGTRLDIEQIAVITGEGWVLTFQELHGDVLDPLRRRINEGLGPIRTAGAAYLAYAIIDTIVDAYYPIIEMLSDRIERLEERLLERPTESQLQRLNRIKAKLVLLRRGIAPQREAVGRLLREPSRFMGESVRPYLRDTLDHCEQLSDAVDSHRELVNGLVNTYLSLIANKSNEIMKLLTLMASIFIPLTFLAGIYGMNFDNMPELRTPWAYPVLLFTMISVGLGMVLYFRRRGWIGGEGDDDEAD